MRVTGILLAGGRSRRFGSDKLSARLADGRRLVDAACGNFLDGGFDPVLLVGGPPPADVRVVHVTLSQPTAEMIQTLRRGIEAAPEQPLAFAPADMPCLAPGLIRQLREAFREGAEPYLLPRFRGRRGHPAFARHGEDFVRRGDREGAREVFRAAGEGVRLVDVETADVLFDVDTREDLEAAGDAASRYARLVARGQIRPA